MVKRNQLWKQETEVFCILLTNPSTPICSLCGLCGSKTSRLPSLLRVEKCHITTAARKCYYLILIDLEHLLK